MTGAAGRRDRGAATVWALALVSLLGVVAAGAAVAGELAVVRARVATVADLAALAGAQSSSACPAAAWVAAAHDMALESCGIDAVGDVRVRVRAGPPPLTRRVSALMGGAAADIVAEARAGPP